MITLSGFHCTKLRPVVNLDHAVVVAAAAAAAVVVVVGTVAEDPRQHAVVTFRSRISIFRQIVEVDQFSHDICRIRFEQCSSKDTSPNPALKTKKS